MIKSYTLGIITVIYTILFSSGQLFAQVQDNNSKGQNQGKKDLKDSIKDQVIIKYEITANGDTIFRYDRIPFDFGKINNQPPLY